MIRALIAERTDPVLFELSYDYVGDLSETVALMWPARDQDGSLPHEQGGHELRNSSTPSSPPSPRSANPNCRRSSPLARCARRDRALGAAEARHRRAAHRRFGAARQDRRRRARRQGRAGDRADLARLHAALCRTVRLARRPRRQAGEPRSGAVPAGDARACARGRRSSPRSIPPISWREWKWDGIRVQAVAGLDEHGGTTSRLYSRTGEDISGSFPDLIEALRLPAARSTANC